MSTKDKTKKPQKSAKRWLVPILILAAAGAALAAVKLAGGDSADASQAVTYTVRRQNLQISVLESGSITALRQKEIRSEVEGNATILKLVEEGTMITERHIEEGLVLVELDSSDTQDRIAQQQITLGSAEASFTQARESYDIQEKQNESNITGGELKVLFTRMDMDKYLGEAIAQEVIDRGITSYRALAEDPRLEGEALQRVEKLRSDIRLAEEELKRSESKLTWTEQLADKQFVSQDELQADRLALERRQVDIKQAQMSLDIFLQYDFPRQVQQRLADVEEALRELSRIEARARAELAKAEASLKNSQASLRVQEERYERLLRQLEASVIKATSQGMVVYADSGGQPMEEGMSVRSQQLIITLPDTSAMGAEIKVHEASVERVRRGQRTTITVDAYPELQFYGRVTRRAPLPDRQHRWLNPDLKVYSTTIAIEGHTGAPILIPGLTCRVEVMIDTLLNVLAVPLQAVVPRGNARVVYVQTPRGLEMRPVITGQANDSFIHIKSGLEEGERVVLNPPRFLRDDESNDKKAEEKTEDAAPEAPETPLPDNGVEENAEPEPRGMSRLLENLSEAERKQLESMSAEERRTFLQERFGATPREGGRGRVRGETEAR